MYGKHPNNSKLKRQILRAFCVLILTLLTISVYSQTDSVLFEKSSHPRSVLSLKVGGQFTVRQWGEAFNYGANGRYEALKDTLFLVDFLEPDSLLRVTRLQITNSELIFICDTVAGFDYKTKELRQKYNIPDSSKIMPPSLRDYVHKAQRSTKKNR
jgi:hypothetical protein